MEKTNNQNPQFMENLELLSRPEVAQLLHVSISYIDHLSDLPSYKLGKKKLYNKQEVLEFLFTKRLIPVSKTISKTDQINNLKEVADE